MKNRNYDADMAKGFWLQLIMLIQSAIVGKYDIFEQ